MPARGLLHCGVVTLFSKPFSHCAFFPRNVLVVCPVLVSDRVSKFAQGLFCQMRHVARWTQTRYLTWVCPLKWSRVQRFSSVGFIMHGHIRFLGSWGVRLRVVRFITTRRLVVVSLRWSRLRWFVLMADFRQVKPTLCIQSAGVKCPMQGCYLLQRLQEGRLLILERSKEVCQLCLRSPHPCLLA